MNEILIITIFIMIAIISAALGWAVANMRNHKELASLRETNARLQTTLELEQKNVAEKLATIEQAREQLNETFAALSSRALKSNTDEFLKLAQENFKQLHIKSQNDLQIKEKSIESLVKPVRDALEKTEKQIQRMEHERKEAFGSISKHLENISISHDKLQGETRNLVQALKRPEVRGRWGELTLRRVVELAGMVDHCDFYEQEHTVTEDGALRPDMIIRMAEGRELVVDAKTPLDSYLQAIEATDDETRDKHLKQHARNVRNRVKELADKSYWNQFSNAPDFVVLFIPGDQFLNAALDHDRQLQEDALKLKVILATPSILVALLQSVAYGWRQHRLTEHAEQIRTIGEDLYNRLGTFGEYLAKMGKSLDSCVSQFNNAVGSFERRVLPGARKFTEMGITSKKSVDEIEQIDRMSKPVLNADAEKDPEKLEH